MDTTPHTFNSKPSDAIAVTASKHILFLPLRLSGRNLSDEASFEDARVGEITNLKSGGWQTLKQPHASHWLGGSIKKAGQPGQFDQFSYGEFVYFHPFIQDILYPKAGETKRPLTILAKKDCTALRIATGPDPTSRIHELPITRLWLCMFEFGVAVAMLELQGDSANLSELLNLQNIVRRDYPPYFGVGGSAAEYPFSVEVVHTSDKNFAYVTDPCHFRQVVSQQRMTPLAPHWTHLLAPLTIRGAMAPDGSLTPEKPNQTVWVQTIDERLPSMTFIQSPDAGYIRYEDWVRLGSMDGPDTGVPYYGADFLKAHFDNATFYDRHWHQVPACVGPSHGTRYAISGYGFVCCGQTNPTPKEFEFARDVLTHHFSRMYAMMGLLLHAQHAALLSISAHASDLVDNKSIAPHIALQNRFSRFVQRFWFSNLSNQIQARELYDVWSRNLGLEPLYREVKEQIRDAGTDLAVLQQSRQNDAALRLNSMAAIALPATIATGILGMNALISDKAIPALGACELAPHILIVCLVFGVVYGLTLVGMLFYNCYQSRRNKPEKRIGKGLILTLCGIALLAGVGFACSWSSIKTGPNETVYQYLVKERPQAQVCTPAPAQAAP